MNFKGIRVLLADGGDRQTLTILHELRNLECIVTVLCSSKLDECYASNKPNKKILNIDADSSSEKYADFVLNEVKTGNYDVLMPVAEMSTNKITGIEAEIKKYVKIACAPRKAYIQAFDKQRTFELAVICGMPCPKTRLNTQSVEEYLTTVDFPIIIKPRNGVGSIGFHKFDKREDFWPFVKSHGINIDEYVIQEFIHYKKRLGAILVVDQNGNVCTSYANEILRWYPIDAGTATLIRSIDNHKLLEDCGKLLKAMNWQGVAALSFMVDEKDGIPKLCEINGRIPASIKLSYVCGFNVSKQLIEIAYGEEVTKYPENTQFGLLMRHSQAELAWFFKSPERFTCEPSWFSWKNTYDVVFWKDDIKPYITYTIKHLKNYKKDMKKRAH